MTLAPLSVLRDKPQLRDGSFLSSTKGHFLAGAEARARLAGRCLSPFAAEREDERSYCYDSAFTGCIVACFEERQPMTPETASWDVVAACVDLGPRVSRRGRARAMSPFASKTLAHHLRRGGAAVGLIALAIHINHDHPLLAVVAGLAAVLALRGCPMCWTVGLFETLRRE